MHLPCLLIQSRPIHPSYIVAQALFGRPEMLLVLLVAKRLFYSLDYVQHII